MARKLSHLPNRSVGAQPIYPWGEWADGSAWRITYGEDFHVAPHSMAGQIRNYARSRGMKVRAFAAANTVDFQFIVEQETAA